MLKLLQNIFNDTENKEEKEFSLKYGLRRLIVTLILLATFIVLVAYIKNGFIFDAVKFKDNIIIKSEQTQKELSIKEFYNTYLSDNNSILGNILFYSKIKCNPYKQICKIENIDYIFENQKSFSFNIIDNSFKKENTGRLIMPSSFQYLSWQIIDLCKILFGAILIFVLYLIIEFTFCWIITGFNFNFKNINIPQISNKSIVIIIIAMIIASAYTLVEIQKINYKEKIRQEEIKFKESQQIALDRCLADAEQSYFDNWDSQCKSLNKKADCSLPTHRANQVEKWRTDAQKQCMDKFKNNGFNIGTELPYGFVPDNN